MSKNTFSITDDIIYIHRPEWDFIAQATIRDDYVDEIKRVTWGLKDNRYPHNAMLGTLHSYVMKHWYGEQFCNEMKEKGFVIDHIDNVSHNCCIENLYFLTEAYNVAKGRTFDQENKDKRFMACCIWPPSGSSGIGTPGARIGTWYSANWRSCSPTARQADPPEIGFPEGWAGIHAAYGAHTVPTFRERCNQGE